MSIIKESLMSKINEQEFSGTLDNTSEFKNAITHIKTVLKNKIGKHETINNSIFKLMLVINKLRKQKTNVSQNKLKNKVE